MNNNDKKLPTSFHPQGKTSIFVSITSTNGIEIAYLTEYNLQRVFVLLQRILLSCFVWSQYCTSTTLGSFMTFQKKSFQSKNVSRMFKESFLRPLILIGKGLG